MSYNRKKHLPKTLLLLLLALLCAWGALGEDEGFFRMDRDSRAAWQGEPANLRLLTRGRYKFGKPKKRYGLDEDATPDTRGLDTLNISGSAQFSRVQFLSLARTLRRAAPNKQIIVVDLRQESHAFLNGYPISWYATHNWANYGRDLAAVEADELERFGALAGKTIRAYGVSHDEKKGQTSITVKRWTTEKALVLGEGFGYLRLPAPDHAWPPAALIDAFIQYVQGLDMEKVWLHFHCHAGVGRTGIFMMIYDKLKNPDVPMEDIVLRQTLTGSDYPLYRSRSDSFHGRLNAEKADMTPLLFEYLEENRASGYAVPWSQWLAEFGKL